MPRQRRTHVVGGVYHVVLRGNHRQPIFSNGNEYLRFEKILAEALHRYGATLFAYCWMTNHVHMAIRVAEAPLGEVMRVTASRYARWRQSAVPTTGHLFERRYRASLIDTDRYLLALVRYIHINPVRAQIVVNPADYPWSSHQAYLGGHGPYWLYIGFVLEMLGPDGDAAQAAYRRFMSEESAESERIALSLTARNAVALRATQATTATDAVAKVHAPRNLEVIATDVAREQGVHIDEVLSRRRSPDLMLARAEIARQALREGAANLSQVALFLGRAPSTLSELLRAERYRAKPKP